MVTSLMPLREGIDRITKGVKKFFSPSLEFHRAQNDYRVCVEQSRHPFFYTHLEVADTPLGRLELMTLHLFLILYRFKQEKTPVSQRMSQHIVDFFAIDLVESLSHLILSEKKQKHSVQERMKGFYGRLLCYDEAMTHFLTMANAFPRGHGNGTSLDFPADFSTRFSAKGGREGLNPLALALLKNVYQGGGSQKEHAFSLAYSLAGYMITQCHHLLKSPLAPWSFSLHFFDFFQQDISNDL